ncbi:unnamed protein product [Candida verbasci]|uniref:glucan 1,4-alpha-glucosidase n=1 Tax=Candida verbasci TaxID=1227364 RepID=A0A9W4TY27_9ASCO|nr:unnamed protein product [Candida verbasci]
MEWYIWNQYQLQRINNRSGNFTSLNGLGEPKFNVDLTSFDDNWGRPQRDGPALRSQSIMKYLTYLNQTGLEMGNGLNSSFVYHKIIKPDLSYIMSNFKFEGFDLWEEINSIHFFTAMVQLNSLSLGIEYSHAFNDTKFEEMLNLAYFELKQFITDFGFLNSIYINEHPKSDRSGLDIASILAIIHTDLNIANENKVMTTLGLLSQAFKSIYPINKLHEFELGNALGRYPEDIYDGYGTSEGNPWFLSTATAAEFIYRMIYNLITKKKDIIIDETNAAFYKNIVEGEGAFSYDTNEYDKVISALLEYGDSYLNVVKFHSDKGRMSEQFNKYTGFMQGAEDLTWSYGAVYNAIHWRENVESVRMQQCSKNNIAKL